MYIVNNTIGTYYMHLNLYMDTRGYITRCIHFKVVLYYILYSSRVQFFEPIEFFLRIYTHHLFISTVNK
jgi:hypothetical protein